MPELPEVETVRKLLEEIIITTSPLEIKDVIISWPKMIKTHSLAEFKKCLIGQKIHKMDRKAKHLMFVLDDYVLISHLRMEGKYFYENPDDMFHHNHTLARLVLSNGKELRYNDTRKFGTFHLYSKDEYDKVGPLTRVGPEPFDKMVTLEYMKEKLSGKTQAIKTKLLDQSIISGLGNIYVDEVLFHSRIHPQRTPASLSDDEIQAIINNSIKVLTAAIKAGGTTINTFEVSHGVTGRFQLQLKVHTKKGEECPVCKDKIVKTKVNGRGTYYCPTCQPKEE